MRNLDTWREASGYWLIAHGASASSLYGELINEGYARKAIIN